MQQKKNVLVYKLYHSQFTPHCQLKKWFTRQYINLLSVPYQTNALVSLSLHNLINCKIGCFLFLWLNVSFTLDNNWQEKKTLQVTNVPAETAETLYNPDIFFFVLFFKSRSSVVRPTLLYAFGIIWRYISAADRYRRL